MGSKLTLVFLTLALLYANNHVMSTKSGTEFNKQAAAFALDLYQTLIQGREKENIVVSPLSIHTALGMAFMGSAGKTMSEMATVLRISEDKEASADRYRHVLCKYKNSTMIKIANKIYVQEGKKLSTKFVELSQKNFKSEASNVDFGKNDDAAKIINTWVETKTNNKIKDLIDPSSLNSDTRLVLVNAIHFKGQWKNKFKSEFTKKDDFWISETESVKVDMMSNNKANYPYGVFADLDATAVELPFNGEDLSMLIILPNSKTGLSALENKLKNQDLIALRKTMHSQEVIVSMPKFQIEFSVELKNVLEKMGMGTIFSGEADFSEILEKPEPLYVSKVVHKAFIDVNEEGAEAAAATEEGIDLRMLIEPEEFTANRSFIFFITTSNETLFMGQQGFFPKPMSRSHEPRMMTDSGSNISIDKFYIVVIVVFCFNKLTYLYV